jgi:hypothetical protein
MTEVEQLLNTASEILALMRSGESKKKIRRKYRYFVRKYRRWLWDNKLEPIVEDVESAEWLDEAEQALLLIRLTLSLLGRESAGGETARMLTAMLDDA